MQNVTKRRGLVKHIRLQWRFKMFVADVKCSQATWQTVPNSRTDSAKASVSKAVVRTWHHTRYQRKTEGIVGCLRRPDGYHQPGT